MDINDISDELRNKAQSCASVEELIVLAETEGLELTDEQLEGFAGGSSNIWDSDR